MTLPIASKTRKQIRQEIADNLDSLYLSEATATGTTTSLIDDTLIGGENDHRGNEVLMLSGTAGNIGKKARVVAFHPETKTLILSPALPSATADGDDYEMHDKYSVNQIDRKINSAIVDATNEVLKDKEDHSLYKLANIYEYTVPTGFIALHKVEYEYSVGVKHLLDDCEDAFTAGSSVTATADETFEKVGTACAKFVVADAAASGATLCYEDFSAVDISDCDKVEFWMYSSIALTAGEVQFMLGATAAIASPLETIDIPAMTAATWYKHCLSLANPHLDTAIISIGVRQASGVDVGAFTFYLDDVNAIKNNSRIFERLNPDFWSIVQATTPLLKLTQNGYAVITNNRMLRLEGYQIPAELSADTSTSEVDPEFVIAKATAYLLMSKARGREVDPDDRARRSDYWMRIAETRLRQMRTSLAMNCRWVGR